MAIDTPLVTRQRIFAAVAETTTGTPMTLNSASGAFNCFNPKMTPSIKMNEREGQSAFSRLPGVPGARSGKFTGRTEVYGSGTAGTPAGWMLTLLAACGFNNGAGGVMTPYTANPAQPTLTIGMFEAGRLRSISGACGTAVLKGKAGDPMTIDWTFDGVWQPPTSTALITPTYPTLLPPRFAGATVTVGATPYRIDTVEINLGVKVTLREDANNIAGYHAAYVVDRMPTIKIDPEALPLSTQDWYAAQLAGTLTSFSCAVGITAGNIVTIAAPNIQLNAAPDNGDRNGIMTDQLEFLCTRNSSAGDDELTITPG